MVPDHTPGSVWKLRGNGGGSDFNMAIWYEWYWLLMYYQNSIDYRSMCYSKMKLFIYYVCSYSYIISYCLFSFLFWSYDDVLLLNLNRYQCYQLNFPSTCLPKDRLTIRAGVSVIMDGACRFINKDVIHSQHQTQLQENHQDRQTIKGGSVSWNWFPGFQWFDFAILLICK